MAKDDYFVLVYKILAYLYECIKGKKKLDFSYLQPMTKDFPVLYRGKHIQVRLYRGHYNGSYSW